MQYLIIKNSTKSTTKNAAALIKTAITGNNVAEKTAPNVKPKAEKNRAAIIDKTMFKQQGLLQILQLLLSKLGILTISFLDICNQ